MRSRIAAAAVLATGTLAFVAPATARDDVLTFPVAEVLNNPEYAAKLQGVKFFFGDTAHPAVAKEMGEYQSNKKTNAFNKSDKEACQWAFLSALISFHDRAIAEGGDAVINIHSFYKKQDFKSDTDFQCGAGATMAGVTLKGTVVKLK
jgi:hypothetical protein